ncbi:unnamed protein product [Rhizophagus irregularis]|uniref:Uncharacterized protein n=1 Tax=Rhizophagus irregularis TaxID=588596 RepID=A0A916DZI1_9GLOM|nr:unnamed protein product [Rhizophagus irregularis]CAB5216590.1 unnamed protein product [Rhizophagus irregularis]CAB5321884.1 unnamed protein product [Rhizophagus irregularis]
MTAQFLKEIELHNLPYETGWIVQCFGITKDPKTENFMMVMKLEEEPKNSNDNDDLLGNKYSESVKIDFTKLNVNSKDENN